MWLWLGRSIHPDEIIAKQLVLLFCGRMSTARRLTWPSFMRGNRTGGSWRILQSRFALVGRFVRERISVAGYDRAVPVFFKVRRAGKEKPPHCVGSEKAKNISKIQKKFIFVKNDGKQGGSLVIITCFFRRFSEF